MYVVVVMGKLGMVSWMKTLRSTSYVLPGIHESKPISKLWIWQFMKAKTLVDLVQGDFQHVGFRSTCKNK